MTESAARAPGTAPATASSAWYAMTPEEALAAQGVTLEAGLTSAEADARRAKVGKNAFAEPKKVSPLQRFTRQYADPMQVVLLVAGVVCLFLPDQFWTGVFLLLLTVFNAGMAMNQEGKAEASASALQSMMVVKAKVRRNGVMAEVPMDQLVPGDIVNIEAGDLVPADARILTAATLEIDESALTGESVPTPKQVDAVAADAALGDRVDMAFMNCQVTRGAGTVLVVTTGMATEVGHISGMLQSTGVEKTPLDEAARRADEPDPRHRRLRARRLDRPRPVPQRGDPDAVPQRRRVRGGGDPHGPPGRRHGDPLEGLADARRRGGDHEAAPVGRDARVHLRDQLGQDRHAHPQPDDRRPDGDVVGRRYSISGDGYSTVGQITHAGGQPDVPLEQYLMPMALCADAEVRNGELVGDPTEGALVVLAAKGGVDPTLTRERYPRVATLPFDAAYKMMATFHAMKDASGKDVIRCYIKGAPDQLLARAVGALGPDGTVSPCRRCGTGRPRRTSGSARWAFASWRPG